MPKRENILNRRKYTTSSNTLTTVSTTLRRATDILRCIGNGINSATEIAAYCNYTVPTVHRLLQHLTELHWTVQDSATHKYYLGGTVTELSGNSIGNHKYLVLHALREMSSLSNLTEETVNLGILDQLHYLQLHEIPSRHNLRITEEGDRLRGRWAGAATKALLSQLDDNELKKALKHVYFEAVARNTVTNKEVFVEQINEVRRKGHSVSQSERINGAVCIAAPIKNYVCPAMISVVGLIDRLKPGVNEIVEAIMDSANRISDDIKGAFDEQGGGT